MALSADIEKKNRRGILYVVATPIGNLDDVSLRAARILKEVSLVAAEDTRHTRKLLASLNVHTPMASYYKGQELSKAQRILEKLAAGDDVALVSDAGTPAVSDPGAILVKKAIAVGIDVVPIPGPSALTAAVSVAGLEDNGFLFLGFLPGRKGERQRLLQSLSSLEWPIVFYESPHKVIKTLKDCFVIFGDRHAFLGRELTKMHEEVLHNGLAKIISELEKRQTIKGEFVVIIHGAARLNVPESDDLDEVIGWYRDNSQMSMRDVCRKISTDLGRSRSEVYNRALEIWK